MLHPSPTPRQRGQWIYCLSAIADVVDKLPALYRVVEEDQDDVRIELHMKAGAWEVLRFAAAGRDNVAGFLSSHLDNSPAAPFPEWLAKAIEALAYDLHWAASRTCAKQGNEIVAALLRFRGSMLQGATF